MCQRWVNWSGQAAEPYVYIYITGKANDILISECVTEKDISYYGNDVNNGLENVQSDTESCRASCKAMGAPYFDFNYGGNHGCYCKNSNAGRKEVASVISGETCPNWGKYLSAMRSFILNSLTHK